MSRPICHAAAAVLAAIILVSGCAQPAPRIWPGCTVTKTTITGTRTEGQSDMRVYTENCGTFKVEDTWYRSDSADVFGRIHDGKTYDIHATGERSSRLSEFPNIMSVVEVAPRP